MNGWSRKRMAATAVFVVVVVVALYLGLPRLAGLEDTWRRLEGGNVWWLAAAVGLECLSFAGYFVLLRVVVERRGERLSLADAYAITMAGVLATRLLATAGAGGVALTVWALRRRGMTAVDVAIAVTTFLILLYAVYMAALVAFGVGLAVGLFSGAAPPGLTIVPAAFGGAVILAASVLALVPRDVASRPASDARHPQAARWLRLLAVAPATFGASVREALRAVRTPDPRLLGAVAWWGFDVGVLWACFEAFGDGPDAAVLILGYFVGMLGNLLPLPGGVGGVDGGMIAAFIGFGVASGLAIVAVLSYRAIAFWLPMLPSVPAYLQLRRMAPAAGDVRPVGT